MKDFLHDFEHLLTDPAHLAVELTLMFVVDILILGLLWPLFKRLMKRSIFKEHLRIDAEHGVDHPEHENGNMLWTFH